MGGMLETSRGLRWSWKGEGGSNTMRVDLTDLREKFNQLLKLFKITTVHSFLNRSQ